MNFLSRYPFFSIFSTSFRRATKRIFINPKPRYIQEMLMSKTLYFHAATGPIANNKKDILYKNINVYCYIFARFDENQELSVYVFTGDDKFYSQKKRFFRKWLLNKENQLIFFNYSLNLVLFCEHIGLTNVIQAQLLDLFMLCFRVHNDIEEVEIYDWFQEITKITLSKLPNKPNFKNKKVLISIKNQIKALCFLTDYFQNSNYEWVNSHTENSVNLLAYYEEYDKPLLAPIIYSMIQGYHLDLEKHERLIEENEKKEKELAQKFKKIFGIAYDKHIFTNKKLFETELKPSSWDFPKSLTFPKDKQGYPSISAETLKAFRFANSIQDERLNLFIKIKEHLTKVIQLKTFVQLQNQKLFCNIKLGGARTGRITTSAPNVQGVHSIYKNLLIAPKGKIFLIMDLGQAELKIIAHLIQEPTMLKIFAENQDIHAYFRAQL